MSNTAFKHNEGSKASKKTNRPFNLMEAPTFYPTKEEFKNAYGYIKSIAQESSKYGIVKIVPPRSWSPKFSLDTGVCMEYLYLFFSFFVLTQHNSFFLLEVQISD